MNNIGYTGKTDAEHLAALETSVTWDEAKGLIARHSDQEMFSVSLYFNQDEVSKDTLQAFVDALDGLGVHLAPPSTVNGVPTRIDYDPGSNELELDLGGNLKTILQAMWVLENYDEASVTDATTFADTVGFDLEEDEEWW